MLVVAYWVAPWLGVVLTDRLLRAGTMTTRRYTNWAGPIAFVVATVVSVWLFSDQTQYVGRLVTVHPGLGDITPLVGFVLVAALYAVLFKPLAQPTPAAPPEVVG